MDIIRYIIAIILGLFGLYIVTMNWCIFVLWLLKKKGASMGGFLGGLCLCISFAIIPNNPYVGLCWLAFVVDIGSLPLIVWTGIYLLMGKHKDEREL